MIPNRNFILEIGSEKWCSKIDPIIIKAIKLWSLLWECKKIWKNAITALKTYWWLTLILELKNKFDIYIIVEVDIVDCVIYLLLLSNTSNIQFNAFCKIIYNFRRNIHCFLNKWLMLYTPCVPKISQYSWWSCVNHQNM